MRRAASAVVGALAVVAAVGCADRSGSRTELWGVRMSSTAVATTAAGAVVDVDVLATRSGTTVEDGTAVRLSVDGGTFTVCGCDELVLGTRGGAVTVPVLLEEASTTVRARVRGVRSSLRFGEPTEESTDR